MDKRMVEMLLGGSRWYLFDKSKGWEWDRIGDEGKGKERNSRG